MYCPTVQDKTFSIYSFMFCSVISSQSISFFPFFSLLSSNLFLDFFAPHSATANRGDFIRYRHHRCRIDVVSKGNPCSFTLIPFLSSIPCSFTDQSIHPYLINHFYISKDCLRKVLFFFFKEDFELEDGGTFHAACPFSLDPEENFSLQERLTQYLDVVEVDLVREIALRSEIVEACGRIRALKETIRTLTEDLVGVCLSGERIE